MIIRIISISTNKKNIVFAIFIKSSILDNLVKIQSLNFRNKSSLIYLKIEMVNLDFLNRFALNNTPQIFKALVNQELDNNINQK